MPEGTVNADDTLPEDQRPFGFAEHRRRRFDPLDTSNWARELRLAFAEGRRPAFETQSVLHWAAALDLLFLAGKLDAVEHGVRLLYQAYPNFSYARNAYNFFKHLPPANERVLPFRDDVTKEVQIIKRDNSTTVLFLFCDHFHRLGMPLALMHRWIGQLPATLVYVRDFRRLCGLAGLRSIAPDRTTTVARMREIASALGANRILCYGSSAGAFPALHYGLDLAAESVLAMGGPTDFEKLQHEQRMEGTLARMRKAGVATDVNLGLLYRAAQRSPRASIVYAADNHADRGQAASMQGLPGVTLYPIADYAGHNVVIEVIGRGMFPQLLDLLMGESTGF